MHMRTVIPFHSDQPSGGLFRENETEYFQRLAREHVRTERRDRRRRMVRKLTRRTAERKPV
jgi:hypothetical protein